MIGIGATLFKRAVMGSRGFSPSALFANGEKGVWYDPSNLSSMKQFDGVTPSTPGDSVGVIEDQSGNGIHMIQTVEAKCPILRLSGDGLYYLDFDGVDDGMRTTSNLPFGSNSVQEMSTFAAVRKDAAGALQNVMELSNNLGSTDGVFRLFYTAGNLWRSVHKGDASNTLQSAVITDNPNKIVMASVASISAPSHLLRIDGSLVNSNTDSLGNGPYTDQLLSIGSRAGGTSSRLSGRIYGIIVRGKVSTAEEIANVEKYLAAKSGVTLS